MRRFKICLWCILAALTLVSCEKNGGGKEGEKLKPSVTCAQDGATILRGVKVSVNVANIAASTEVSVKFGREKTLTRTGPGLVSYAFETGGLKTITVTMAPAEMEKQTFRITVENLETLQSLAQRLRADKDLILVMAHRANSSDFSIPENSLPAIEKCIKDKVDIVENDLYTTKDGYLVVSHDSNLNRETNGSGEIKDKTLAQIKDLFLRDRNNRVTDQKMLTFDEYLDACKGRIYINVDLGDRIASIPDVVTAIARKGMTDQVLVYCNSDEKIISAFASNPECNVYSWVGSATTLVGKGLPDHVYWTQCGWNPTTPEASRTGAVDSGKQPTSRSTVANAVNAGTLLSVNAIYTLNTAQFWPQDFKVAQVNDIRTTFPACQCIHVDTGLEARKAILNAGYHLLNPISNDEI